MAQALIEALINTAVTTANTSKAYTTTNTGDVLTALCCVQGVGTTCTTMTISDTLGNAWVPVWNSIQSPAGGTVNKFIQGWFCISKASGANTVSIVTNAATGIGLNALAIARYSGYTTVAIDQKAVAAAAGSTTMTPLTLTTTQNNQIVFGFSDTNASQTANPTGLSSPYSVGAAQATHNVVSLTGVVAAAGAINFSGTWDTGTGNTNISAAFTLTADPGFVQGNGNFASSGALAYRGGVTKGNLLIAVLLIQTAGQTVNSMNVSDTVGSKWNVFQQTVKTGNNYSCLAWAIAGATATANTVSFTSTATVTVNGASANIVEFSGFNQLEQYQLSAVTNITTGGTKVSPTVTPNAALSLMVAQLFGQGSNPTVFAASNGFTENAGYWGNAAPLDTEWKILTAAAATSTTITVTQPSGTLNSYLSLASFVVGVQSRKNLLGVGI